MLVRDMFHPHTTTAADSLAALIKAGDACAGHSLPSNFCHRNSTTLSHASTSKLNFMCEQINFAASGSVCPFSMAWQTSFKISSKIPPAAMGASLAAEDVW